MALVGYSDSEGSDTEPANVSPPAPAKPAPAATRPGKPAFHKVVDPTAPRRIKVELPTIKPDVAAQEEEEQRPAKRVRTAGFSGFNSFLPAPKRAAEPKKQGLGAGVNLRTGAEPAFSRERPDPAPPAAWEEDVKEEGREKDPVPAEQEQQKPAEVKMVGNAMRFKPLSVANGKKRAPKKKIVPGMSNAAPAQATTAASTHNPPTPAALAPLPPPKPKVSLFSVATEHESATTTTQAPVAEYQPFLADPQPEATAEDPAYLTQASAAAEAATTTTATHHEANTLDALASDLPLSAQDRRRLFGRNSSNQRAPVPAAQIKHLDIDEEYRRNQAYAQQVGQAEQHRAVKAIAPGKHSLQQLVNAAATQKEALEDAWAEGKRNKAEGGSRYGW